MSSEEEIMNILLRNVRMLNDEKIIDMLDEYEKYLKNLIDYFDYDKGVISLGNGEAYVFGDIHGDLITLVSLLEKIHFNIHLKKGNPLIFLGDYIDRGDYQVETINFLILLQLSFKDRIIMLRGNHEPPRWLLPYPHDFPMHLRSRYPRKWREIYEKYLEIFQYMPHITYSKSGVFFVHGGISVKTVDLKQYKNPSKEILTEILWNDPIEGTGIRPSYRGVGYLWGEDVTERFLKENNMKVIVRGHEPCNGYMWKHSHRVLTLFSRLGSPYNNTLASTVKINLKSWKPLSINNFISLSSEERPMEPL